MSYYRPRRLRKSESMRSLTRETLLSVNDLIYPLFVTFGKGVRAPIESMPGCFRLSVDQLVKEVVDARSQGILALLLFGIPETKDETGSEAYNRNGIVQQAVRAIKQEVPDMLVVTDVCMCEYTSHGHCGIVKGEGVSNDETLQYIADIALSHAEAGADIVAPSDMMDNRVLAIRKTLETQGFPDVAIMSYAVKYASAFYGPFRDAADCAPQHGDRRSYQMDPANSREAIKEAMLDIEESADILMVKPALVYLDIISKVKASTNVPVAAYNVSGEYAMIKAAAQNGWLDERRYALEMLTSIKRAGADMIVTYYAREAASWLSE